jgi:crossover junction endodeoxyribonuclease RuvC
MQKCRIIGLDPGLRTTGWGVIDTQNNRLSYVAHGLIKPDTTVDLADRLSHLFAEIKKLVEAYSPDEAAVEETFMNVNPASALKLGQARGVVLVTPAVCGLAVAEYTANQVKKSVVGAGHADKNQVMAMIQILLPTSGKMTADSADALAVAICHAHFRTTKKQWEVA